MPLCGDAGTVVIVHYDLWHRARANESDRERYMLKFLFARLEEPHSPAWDNEESAWRPPVDGMVDELDEVCRHLWSWNRGSTNGQEMADGKKGLAELISSLGDEDEVVRLDSAYTLGSCGAPAVPALLGALDDTRQEGSNRAAFALAAVGDPVAPALIEALGHENKTIRASAAYALGNILLPNGDLSEVFDALTRALGDRCEWVRRNAAEAVGAIGQPTPETVAALGQLLSDELGWIRENATRALAKIGPAAAAALPALVAALGDESRYVRYNAGAALKRIDTDRAREALYEDLLTSRWCPLTTDESPY